MISLLIFNKINMKKYTFFIFALSFLVFGILKAQAAVNPNNTPSASTASPSITVLSPNGGEVYQAGQQITIKWKSINMPSNPRMNIMIVNEKGVVVDESTDILVQNNQSWLYTLNANISTGKYKVWINFKDNLAVDYSDNFFTINSQNITTPLIKVLSPNGGENYRIGQKVNVSWSMKGFSSWDNYNAAVQIQLWDKTGQNYIGSFCTYCNSAQNGGSYNWTIDKVFSPNDTYINIIPGEYKIRVSVVGDNNVPLNYLVLDFSDSYFKISNSYTTTPSITVTYPNGGESYSIGQQINVKWNTIGFSNNANIGIDLTQKIGDVYSAIKGLSNTTNDGSETITIPDVTLGSNYVITVGVFENGVVNKQLIDRSDSTFTIKDQTVSNECSIITDPWIKIISPNGGEVYKTGDLINIRWKTCNYGDKSKSIKISYDLATSDSTGTSNTFLMSQTGLLNDGSESVVIPSTISSSGNYKIRIFTYDPDNTVNGGGFYYRVDSSDNTFTIINNNGGKVLPVISEVVTSSTYSNIIRKGIKNDSVTKVQNILIKSGYSLVADGSFGPKTESAVKSFQQKNSLTADGVIGPKTWAILNSVK